MSGAIFSCNSSNRSTALRFAHSTRSARLAASFSARSAPVGLFLPRLVGPVGRTRYSESEECNGDWSECTDDQFRYLK